MKRAIIAILCVLLLAGPAAAQGPVTHTLYLPLVETSVSETCQRPWRLVEPEATTNFVLNPSAEAAGNYAALGGAVVNRVATAQAYGLYSFEVTSAAGGDGLSLTTLALAASPHYVTLRVAGVLPANWRIGIAGHLKTPQLIERIDPDWTLYGALFSAAEAGGAAAVTIVQAGAGNGLFFVDGVQAEAKPYWTTYADGDQPGCKWLGTAHAAISERSAQSRAGGLVLDFWRDFGFFVEEMLGVGAATSELGVDSYALLPGGQLNSVKVEPRQFTLVGRFIASSEEELHRKRQALIKVLSHDLVPADADGWQPVRLWYSGAEVTKVIAAHYDGGLEGKLDVSYGPFQVGGETQWRKLAYWSEKTTVRFMAPDPYFYEIGESAALLDTNDSATTRTLAARLVETGQWDPLGPPHVAGIYADIRAIAEDDDYVFWGGDFTNFDNLGVGPADYIIRYRKSDHTWLTIGGADNVVNALVVAPNGDLFAGGAFLNIGGVAANRVARWDGVAWNALGVGVDDVVRALEIDLDGILFAGGDFLNAGGAGANHVASWNGVAWAALGAGVDDVVRALVVDMDNLLFVGGDFLNAGGAGANHVASWDGAAWDVLGAGVDDVVRALAIDLDNGLFVGGDFLNAGAGAAAHVARWNGISWSALAEGTNNTVYSLEVGPDRMLYAGGLFTSAGSLDLPNGVARWNSSVWAHTDIEVPGPPASGVLAFLASESDPVVAQNYDLWIGFGIIGVAAFAGITPVPNDGTAPAYPKIIFTRSGGTGVTIETVRNETTGKLLLFDYHLQDGERLTVDTSPLTKSVVSKGAPARTSSKLGAVLANSDFGSFCLQPGNNDISSFVVGTLWSVTWLQWKDTFRSLD